MTGVGWRRSSGIRRRQFRWVTLIQLAGLITPVAVFALPGSVGPVAAVANTLVMQVLFVVAILQWRAFEVDVVVRRSTLAASFLVVGLGTYALVVSVVSTLSASTARSLRLWVQQWRSLSSDRRRFGFNAA